MKKLHGEKLEEYYSNIEKMSSLLSRNEELIRDAGYNPPVDNFFIEKEKRIKLVCRSEEGGNFLSTYSVYRTFRADV